MPAKKQLLSRFKGKQVKFIDRYLTETYEGKLVDFDHQFALIERLDGGKEVLINIQEILGLAEVVSDEPS